MTESYGSRNNHRVVTQREAIADALHQAHLDDCEGCGLSGVEPWVELAGRLYQHNVRVIPTLGQHEKVGQTLTSVLGLVLSDMDIKGLMMRGLRVVEGEVEDA